MAPSWSRRTLLGNKNKSSAVDVHACSSTAERKNEIKGEAREKPGGWNKGWKAWRRRRRRPPPPPPPPPSPSRSSSGAFFVLALVLFSLAALLVAGLASSVLRKQTVARDFLSPSDDTIITSYAPPRNWTSPAAAVRVVDGDTVVAAGIVVRLLGMDAPEDGQLCGRGKGRRSRRIWRRSWRWGRWKLPWRATAGDKNHARADTRQAPDDDSSTSSSYYYDCGAEATRALRGLVAGRALRCERKGTDRYGRALARCFVSAGSKGTRLLSFFFSFFSSSPSLSRDSGDYSVDIGEWMLRRGHAVSYLGSTKAYLEAESAAKRERRGVWGGGEFELPAVWRERRRREREAKAEKQKKKKRKKEKKKKEKMGAKAKVAKAKGSSSGRNSGKKKK